MPFDTNLLRLHFDLPEGLTAKSVGVIIEEMLDIDVDEILDVNYLDSSTPGETNGVQVTFKDGTVRVYEGAELPEALAILDHWTPPTA